MPDPRIQVKVGADVADAQRVMARFGEWIKGGFGIQLANRLTQVFERVPAMLEKTLKVGVAFNSTLEDAELGFAGLLRAISPENFKSLDEAINGSREVIKGLRREAETTASTFEQLVTATQGGVDGASPHRRRADQPDSGAVQHDRQGRQHGDAQFAGLPDYAGRAGHDHRRTGIRGDGGPLDSGDHLARHSAGAPGGKTL